MHEPTNMARWRRTSLLGQPERRSHRRGPFSVDRSGGPSTFECGALWTLRSRGGLIGENSFRRLLLRAINRLEELFPHALARVGRYPMIVVRKD
jgi:hypothetical protein